MRDFGKIIITGRAVEAPELKQTPNGTSVATLCVAQNLGENHAVFWEVNVWRKLAEIVCQYVKKGTSVVVSGQPDMREYTDKDGVKRKQFYITAEDVTFMANSQEKKESANFQEINTAEEDDLPF